VPLALFALCVSFLLSNAVTNAQTNCVAGKYQATAGVESVRVRGRGEGCKRACVGVCVYPYAYL
jgi:hypothetical protein